MDDARRLAFEDADEAVPLAAQHEQPHRLRVERAEKRALVAPRQHLPLGVPALQEARYRLAPPKPDDAAGDLECALRADRLAPHAHLRCVAAPQAEDEVVTILVLGGHQIPPL